MLTRKLANNIIILSCVEDLLPNLIAQSATFQCDKGGIHKLTVIYSPATSDSQSAAANGNCILVPQGTPCSILYGSPCPMVVNMVSKEGQKIVEVGGTKALGADCEFMCPLGGKLTAMAHGQAIAKHNEAAAGLQVTSLVIDFIPIVGSIKSVIEVITGVDPVTGEKTSRLLSAAGIIPGGKVLKGGKVVKAIIKGEKAAVKSEKIAASSAKMAAKGEKTAAKTSQTANKNLPSTNPGKTPPVNKSGGSNHPPGGGNSQPPKKPPRTEPKNLQEKLTLDEAKSGAGNKIEGFDAKQKDARYPPDQWSKMEHKHTVTDGKVSITQTPTGEIVKSSKKVETIDIHFWENTATGERHGFKFKNP